MSNDKKLNEATPDELIPLLRQYQHNDGSGLVFGYDKDGVDRLFSIMARRLTTMEEALKTANDTLAKFPRA